MNIPFRHRQLLFLLLLVPEFLFSQTDYEFWFAAPEVTHAITAPPMYDTVGVDEPVFIGFTTSEGPANVTISQPANPSFVPIAFTVYTSSYFQYDLTHYLESIECKPSNTILNNGLLITSDQPVNAIYEIQNGINSESFSLKGRNALGYEFIIPGQNLYPNYPYCNPPARNRFSIVATEDQTLVKVLSKKALVGHPGTDTVFIMLNRGQTWTGEATSNDTSAHLGGSFVFSDKPIAVTITDDALRPFDADPVLSIDLTGDQLIPKSICGIEYLVTFSWAITTNTNIIYIYAFENSTNINLDGSFLCTLNKGQQYMYITPTFSNSSDYLTSNKPILVYFLGRADGWSTEIYSQVFPPITCAGSRIISASRTGPDYFTGSFNYQIVTKTGNQLNFSCSDPALEVLLDNPTQWFDAAGTSNQYKVLSTVGGFPFWSTTTITNSTGNFQLNVSNLLYTTYRGAVYSNFSSLNLGPDRTLCTGDTIILDAGYGRTSYLWNTGATTQILHVSNPGTYYVTVVSGDCTLHDTIVLHPPDNTPLPLADEVTLCPGDSVILDAGPGRSWYQWSTGDSTRSVVVHQGGAYWVTVPVFNCSNTISDTSLVVVPDSINLGPDVNICQGDSILLDAGPGKSPYLWSTGATSQSIWAKSAGAYSVIGGYKGCIFHDTLIVAAAPVPNVELGPDDSICSGGSRTFDAGFCAGCNYSWDNLTLGNFNIGTLQTFTADIAGTYRVTVSQSNGCFNRDTVALILQSLKQVSVSISTTGAVVCQGSPVTVSSNSENKGISPQYQWYVNGLLQSGNDSAFTYIPADQDTLYCILTSSDTSCVVNNPAQSNSVILSVNPLIPVSVTITAGQNPVCQGTAVSFSAFPSPVTGTPEYQWKVNGVNAGSGLASFTCTPANGDVVMCTLHIGDLGCTTGDPANSNLIVMNVTPSPVVTYQHCTDTVTSLNARPIKLKGGIPLGGTYSGPGVNPSTGIFTPLAAGTGLKEITYSYTNAGLCTSTAKRWISVLTPVSFTCGSELTDVRDNQKYKTLQIGTQCWFAENLRFGAVISSNLSQRDNCIPEKYESSSGVPQSSVYQWDEIMQYESSAGAKGLCPPNWHIPSEAEWQVLFSNWINNAFSGAPLKYSGYSGFNALLIGAEYQNKGWHFASFATLYWTSDSNGPYKAWAHGMNDVDPSVSTYPSIRSNAFSIRCIKD
jgi:uncharacterized protein (TIGR02145 family)